MAQVKAALAVSMVAGSSTSKSASKLEHAASKRSTEEMEPSYKEKLQLVGRLLDIETTKAKKPGNFALSAGLEEPGDTCSLPPSASFMEVFNKYSAELKGEEGSKRAKKRPGEHYDVGAVPRKVKVRMGSYKILDCPWKTTAQSYDRTLLESVLFTGKEPPKMVVPEIRLKDMESASREVVSMLSYMDMFAAASIKALEDVCVKLEDDNPQKELADIVEKLAARGISRNVLLQLEEHGERAFQASQRNWNSCQDTISLLHSIGKSVQGCVKNSVYNIATSMLTRRDAWLEKFKDILPKESLLELRAADLNTDKLFGKEAVEKALEQAKTERKVKVQDSILAAHSAAKAPRTGGKGFQRQPFQNIQPQASQQKPQPQQRQQNQGRGGQTGQNRGGYNRGGRGGGSGYYRGRGRGAPQKSS